MYVIGNCQIIAPSPGITIATTATALGTVSELADAVGLLLHFYNGSNSTNTLATITALFGDADGDPASTLTPGLQVIAAATSFKSNGTITQGSWPRLFMAQAAAAPLQPFGMPKALVRATMDTALSNTVIVEAWPIYFGGRHPAMVGLDSLPRV